MRGSAWLLKACQQCSGDLYEDESPLARRVRELVDLRLFTCLLCGEEYILDGRRLKASDGTTLVPFFREVARRRADRDGPDEPYSPTLDSPETA